MPEVIFLWSIRQMYAARKYALKYKGTRLASIVLFPSPFILLINALRPRMDNHTRTLPANGWIRHS